MTIPTATLCVASAIAANSAACDKSVPSPTIQFPDGKQLTLTNVESFATHRPVTFYQYEGFKGTYDDPHLKSFVLLFADSRQDTYATDRVQEDAAIAKLRKKRISGIKFDKVPDAAITFPELRDYLLAKYEGAVVEKRRPSDSFVDDEIALVDPKTKKQLCVLQYVKFGIPGTFVLLK